MRATSAISDLLSPIVTAHGKQLTRFFLSRVSEPAEAQDLVQEVYSRILKLEHPELIRCPKAYLFRIATNIAREHWLKRAALPPHLELEESAVDPEPTPEDAGETTQRVGQPMIVLSGLSPKVRAALVWAHRDGHTYEEISARLSVPRARWRKRLRVSEIAEITERARASSAIP